MKTRNERVLGPIVLIIAGGKGERFWPRSREKQPKSLHKIYSSKTLLEETWQRALSLTKKERIFIGCNCKLKQAILKKHPNIAQNAFILEPQGRNTAAIIALMTLELEKRFPKSIHIILPVDHYIAPLSKFKYSIKIAIQVAKKDFIATLGIHPSYPASQYGYIHAGKNLTGLDARQVLSFKEKPTLATAKKYLQKGNYFWNSGIFVWRGELILSEFRLHAKQILEPIESALKPREKTTMKVTRKNASKEKRLSQAFQDLAQVPLDIAVLEKSTQLALVPAQFTWNDLGSWDSLSHIFPADINGNVLLTKRKTKLSSLESNDNLIAVDHELVALLGVQDIVVVQEKEILFVTQRKYLPRLKEFLQKIRKNPTLQKYL